jgi:putative ABC transport system substrate-binding protein
MTTRRSVLGACGAGLLLVQFHVSAQRRGSIARVGMLETAPAAMSGRWKNSFVGALLELGYLPGKTLQIEERLASGGFERLAALAEELVQSNPDVMVVATPPAIRAAQKASSTIPIVMVRTSDPVALKFVASIARPGGNITGVSNLHEDLSAKYLELLRLAVPQLSRVTVLINPDAPLHPGFLRNIEAAAKVHGLQVSKAQASSPADIAAVAERMTPQATGALIVLPDAAFLFQARVIADAAARRRIATLYGTAEYVEAGGLMSYGPDRAEDYRRAAIYVDKILKGAKPADLPVEQAKTLELVVNAKTGAAIGVVLSSELRLRANRVIE